MTVLVRAVESGFWPTSRLAALPMAALVLAAAAGCDDGSQQTVAAAPPPSVVVTPVVRKDVTPTMTFVGRVEAIEDVELRARVEGFLEKRSFDEGGDVNKGDLLFLIEQAPYQADVERAQAEVLSADATLTNASLQADRFRSLIKRGNVSQAKLDEAVAEETRAKAAVEEAKAALAQAELNLSYTTIKAPIDGRIGRATYSVGNLVGPSSDPLAELINLDPIYVQIAVGDRQLLDARRDDFDETEQLVPWLVLGDGEKYSEPGVFAFINNKVDVQTDTVTVRATFPNPNKVLLPEQFVTVEIKSSAPVKALVIPQAAVQENQSGRFVLVVDKDDKVKVRQVTMGVTEGTDWIVEQGLDEGEDVIIEGLQKVRPGIAVNPVSEGSGTTQKTDAATDQG